ncbi:hypothetical protein [Methylovorus mays]|uniref:hypothetical protein n=1 Tax=Methylovorus mays TaxID=184077 RepID=UPI001E4A05A3|nr:hypothetical protein [Methylovorus mays]MCB5206099.1 hypothetical protein [Methylovorus mays]
MLAALMFQMLDQIDPDTDNLVDAMKKHMQEAILGATKDIAGITNKISKYERTIKRLSRKGGENVMQSFLTVKVDTLRKKIDQISHVITDMTKLIEVVDTYVYEVDEPPIPQATDWPGLPKMFGRYPYRYPGEGGVL